MSEENKTVSLTSNQTKVLSATESSRQKILAEANQEFKDMFTQIREQLTGEEIHIFESRYKIGELVNKMRGEETKYGAKCIERMETAVGYDRSVIYTSLLFHEKFTPEDVAELLTARNSSGQPLLWTHISHLVRVADKNTRKELQQLALDGSLTPAELLNYIQKKNGGKQASNAGKPLARPKSLKGFIDQQLAYLEQLLKRKDKVWAGSERPGDKSFFDVLSDTPSDKFDSVILTEMEQLEHTYEKASMELDIMATNLLTARKKLERRRERDKPGVTKRQISLYDPKAKIPIKDVEEEDLDEEYDPEVEEADVEEPAPRRGGSSTSRVVPALD